MKYLIVFAHPEPKSFNGSLLDVAVKHLESQGHEVKVSDLYRMNFKPTIDADDFLNHDKNERLQVAGASAEAFVANQLTADVVAEHEKLMWADNVIFQFPLWWFSMPAILKGWIDRVYSCGFAYGVGEHSETRWGDRYGEGSFEGKRAMLLVTVGGWPTHYSARGINGPIDDILFHINHGNLCYPGFTVLPQMVVYRTDKADDAKFKESSEELKQRLDTFQTTKPIAYRRQNFGDYTIPQMELKEGLEQPGETGFAIHVKKD
ncbi:hypothetical protein KAFR_0B05180 [Kazachstania africana CBS 2517]|uniref:Flavodoxin-like fold domain-containing protein n=1 Tax=Kazachstania africana (strain ATCC 22294 / BCRC 22015 / CBS 2517 / CECT 1963 / NBRC 1671 / NRRL Y-8276) TaxID=1071382 RepID=H2AR14_KAZAF|nr:hypothetical protein KAFR_0B05180 [Kazachstania africana CBS 2517]CCF56814.1 hypothetical protein KAFR_0B05180 [Kazachstania africana CBS 2517]